MIFFKLLRIGANTNTSLVFIIITVTEVNIERFSTVSCDGVI